MGGEDLLSQPPKEVDVQVIGGGILGVMAGLLAAEKGLRVIVYRLTDVKAPQADSLRNHAWLQSGLLYARELTLAAVRQMNFSGRALFDKFAMALPPLRGVFRVPT